MGNMKITGVLGKYDEIIGVDKRVVSGINLWTMSSTQNNYAENKVS